MATSKRKEHITPHGGVSSEIFFKDDEGKAVDESQATQAEIVEYNREGEVIHRTYGTLGRRKPAEDQ